jgi:hypothetical protein
MIKKSSSTASLNKTNSGASAAELSKTNSGLSVASLNKTSSGTTMGSSISVSGIEGLSFQNFSSESAKVLL